MIEFKGSYFEREVILLGVRWYMAYSISYRQLEEMMEAVAACAIIVYPSLWLARKYIPTSQ